MKKLIKILGVSCAIAFAIDIITIILDLFEVVSKKAIDTLTLIMFAMFVIITIIVIIIGERKEKPMCYNINFKHFNDVLTYFNEYFIKEKYSITNIDKNVYYACKTASYLKKSFCIICIDKFDFDYINWIKKIESSIYSKYKDNKRLGMVTIIVTKNKDENIYNYTNELSDTTKFGKFNVYLVLNEGKMYMTNKIFGYTLSKYGTGSNAYLKMYFELKKILKSKIKIKLYDLNN